MTTTEKKAATVTKASRTNGVVTTSLPLLYSSLVPLSQQDHKDLTFDHRPGFLFAAATNALPILVNEFIHAEKHYPIFFSNIDEPVPLIAVGPHNENRNMFIDGDGQWKHGYYVPNYLRRYPFVLVKSQITNSEASDNSKGQNFILAFDDKAEHLKSPSGVSLFEEKDGKRLVDTFVESCREYAQVGNVTQAFVSALKDNDLLAWQSISRSSPDGQKNETMFSFVAVNGEKVNKLPDEIILEFFKKGWLALIFYHLASLGNWKRIIQDEY